MRVFQWDVDYEQWDKISAEQFFSRIYSDRTRDHTLRIKKIRVMTAIRQGSSSQRVVNVWNGLPKKGSDLNWNKELILEVPRLLSVQRFFKNRVHKSTWTDDQLVVRSVGWSVELILIPLLPPHLRPCRRGRGQLYRFLDALKIEGHRDIGRTCR